MSDSVPMRFELGSFQVEEVNGFQVTINVGGNVRITAHLPYQPVVVKGDFVPLQVIIECQPLTNSPPPQS
jgi:hypothetical protein